LERAEGWRLCLQPDGNQFDLESLVNAPLVGQENEYGGFDPRPWRQWRRPGGGELQWVRVF